VDNISFFHGQLTCVVAKILTRTSSGTSLVRKVFIEQRNATSLSNTSASLSMGNSAAADEDLRLGGSDGRERWPRRSNDLHTLILNAFGEDNHCTTWDASKKVAVNQWNCSISPLVHQRTRKSLDVIEVDDERV